MYVCMYVLEQCAASMFRIKKIMSKSDAEMIPGSDHFCARVGTEPSHFCKTQAGSTPRLQHVKSRKPQCERLPPWKPENLLRHYFSDSLCVQDHCANILIILH